MLVGEQAHGLGSARVDAQYMHAARDLLLFLSVPKIPAASCPSGGGPKRFGQADPAVLRLSVVPVLVAAVILLVCPFARVRAQDEVRALWVVRTSLTSRSDVDAMVDAARASGFNTLLVQIRGRGDAYYANGLEPRPSALVAEPAFDPLAATIARAHDAGLQVHAWINVNLVAGADELPSARDHVIYRHPEWLMVPRALADDLIAVEPRSPGASRAADALHRAARRLSSKVYFSRRFDEQSADHTVGVVRDIVSRYAVDGVHLDYVRYPNDEFDYSRGALAAFRRSVVADPPRRRRAAVRRADRRRAAHLYPGVSGAVARVPHRAHDGVDGAAARRGAGGKSIRKQCNQGF